MPLTEPGARSPIHSREIRCEGFRRDDGLFDPRDTRTVLGIGLSAVHTGPVEGTSEFGVFRM